MSRTADRRAAERGLTPLLDVALYAPDPIARDGARARLAARADRPALGALIARTLGV